MTTRGLPVLAVVIAASWLMSGCSPARDEFSAADETAIRDASARYAKTETAKDADEWAAISTADAVMMPAGGDPVEGRAALVAWAKQIAPGETLETRIDEIRGHGNVAVERGTFTATVPGATPQKVGGRYLVVWERQPSGSWQITRNIWNTK